MWGLYPTNWQARSKVPMTSDNTTVACTCGSFGPERTIVEPIWDVNVGSRGDHTYGREKQSKKDGNRTDRRRNKGNIRVEVRFA